MKYDFIEIGTCDYHTLLEGCSPTQHGISVEPIKTYLDRLPDKPNVIKSNCAISSKDEEVDLFYVTPEVQSEQNLSFTKGWGTIKKPHIGHGPDGNKLVERGILTQTKVEAITWETLCNRYNVDEVIYVKIDTEGHDCVIVNNILDYTNCPLPKKISFEKTHCDEQDIRVAVNRLIKHGYVLTNYDEDLTFEKR